MKVHFSQLAYLPSSLALLALSLSIATISVGTAMAATGGIGGTCVNITQNLKIGSSGSQVSALQSVLVVDGLLARQNATSYFGPITQAALQHWQSNHGIVSSGTPSTTGYGAAGPKTRAAITAYTCSGAGIQQTLFTTVTTTTAASSNTSTTNSQTTKPTTTGVPATSTPVTYKMSDYWPQPTSGSAYLKYFSTDFYGSGNGVNSILTRVTNLGSNNYLNVDVTASTNPATYIDSRYFKVSPGATVVEYRDDSTSTARVYDYGKEILWGASLAVGQSIESRIHIDPSQSRGTYPGSITNVGYAKVTLTDFIPSIMIGATTYTSVIKTHLTEIFCKTSACNMPGTDYDYYELTYWLAPGKGVIQTQYDGGNLLSTITGRTDYLSKECTVGDTEWYCH